MTARLIFDRWRALHDSLDHPQTRAFAKLLSSAVADGEEIADVECPYFLSIADDVRAEIGEIAERLRAHPDCDHRWWIYTDRIDADGYEAPILCSTCWTHPTDAGGRDLVGVAGRHTLVRGDAGAVPSGGGAFGAPGPLGQSARDDRSRGRLVPGRPRLGRSGRRRGRRRGLSARLRAGGTGRSRRP